MKRIFFLLKIIRTFNTKKRACLPNIYTLLSILAVSLAAFSLIMITSIMDGFKHELVSKLISSQAPLQLTSWQDLSQQDPIKKQLKQQPDIIQFSPYLQEFVLFQESTNIELLSLQGIDFKKEASVTKLLDQLIKHSKNIETGLLIGEEFSKRNLLNLGDSVILYSPQSRKQITKNITGIFNSGIYFLDSNAIYLNLRETQDFLNRAGNLTGYKLHIKDPYKSEEIKQKLKAEFGMPYQVHSWMDQNKHVLEAIAIERKMMTIIISILTLLAGFCMLATLSLMILDKQKEIAILRSLGLSKKQIYILIFVQSLCIIIIGELIGISLGLVAAYNINPILSFFENTLGLSLFPDSMYYLSKIPVKLSLSGILFPVFLALMVGLLASYFPAKKASRIDPVTQLKS